MPVVRTVQKAWRDWEATERKFVAAKDTLKKAENATVGKTKLLIFHDLESAARNFSVFP
jgi:hypothetical protein